MPTYSVICTNFDSGKDYRVDAEADTPEEAVKQVIAQGHLTDGRVADDAKASDVTTHYATQKVNSVADAKSSLEQTVMRLEEELVRLSTKVDNLSDKNGWNGASVGVYSRD